MPVLGPDFDKRNVLTGCDLCACAVVVCSEFNCGTLSEGVCVCVCVCVRVCLRHMWVKGEVGARGDNGKILEWGGGGKV